MRFQRIRVERFGPLADRSWGEKEPLPPLVAVVGPNEAGKSAFHELLATLLHGFYPATRDANPWAPWTGGDAEIQAEIRLEDGSDVDVHRRLLATPWAQLRRGDVVEDLRNADLPFVRHVQRDVFLQVYALTLRDLAGLEGTGWDAVQDRLIVGMGTRDLRPPREVVQEWAQQAQGLWRPDRRGSPRYREIRERLGELRKERREALERDRGLRDDERRTVELVGERERLRLWRTRLDRRLEATRRLTELEGRLEEEEEALSRLVERLDEARERAGVLTEEDRALLERGAELRGLAARAPLLQERAVRRGGLDEEIRGLERRVRETASPLLQDEAPVPSADDLEALALPELERRVHAAERSGERVDRLRDRIQIVQEAPLPRSPRGLAGAALALASAGLLVVVLSWIRGESDLLGPATILGLVLVLAGALILHRWWYVRTSLDLRNRELQGLESRLRERERELEGALASARGLLDDLPLRSEVRDRPSPGLVASLARLRELVQDTNDRRSTRDALTRDDREVAEHLNRVRAELLPELPEDPVAALPELGRRLGEAESREEWVRAAETRVRELEEENNIQEARVRTLKSELSTLRETTGVPEEGIDPDDQGVSVLEGKRDALQEEMEELGDELGRLRERLDRLPGEATPDILDGEIELLEDELIRVRRERDRLHVLGRLLLRAERRFRDEHQPDLLRRAESYLARITDGRYRRLILEEGEEGSTFHLEAPHLPHSLPVEHPLSTGTREQVYLALRLAIVDHLDEGREPLPLFLDEVLVNWDADRRGRGLDVMVEMAGGRQVFLFTCHPGLAREVSDRGGAVLTLEAP